MINMIGNTGQLSSRTGTFVNAFYFLSVGPFWCPLHDECSAERFLRGCSFRIAPCVVATVLTHFLPIRLTPLGEQLPTFLVVRLPYRTNFFRVSTPPLGYARPMFFGILSGVFARPLFSALLTFAAHVVTASVANLAWPAANRSLLLVQGEPPERSTYQMSQSCVRFSSPGSGSMESKSDVRAQSLTRTLPIRPL